MKELLLLFCGVTIGWLLYPHFHTAPDPVPADSIDVATMPATVEHVQATPPDPATEPQRSGSLVTTGLDGSKQASESTPARTAGPATRSTTPPDSTIRNQWG